MLYLVFKRLEEDEANDTGSVDVDTSDSAQGYNQVSQITTEGFFKAERST